jgi:hypothetical protein
MLLTLTGKVGRRYMIQTSLDLLTWEPWTNFLSTSASTLLIDTEAVAVPRRFYRAVTP